MQLNTNRVPLAYRTVRDRNDDWRLIERRDDKGKAAGHAIDPVEYAKRYVVICACAVEAGCPCQLMRDGVEQGSVGKVVGKVDQLATIEVCDLKADREQLAFRNRHLLAQLRDGRS